MHERSFTILSFHQKCPHPKSAPLPPLLGPRYYMVEPPYTINPDTPLTYLLNYSAPKYFRTQRILT